MQTAFPVRLLVAVSSALVLVAAVSTCSGEPFANYPASSSTSANKLVFELQPTVVAAGAIFTPPVVVAVQDASGNTFTTATTSVTVAIGTNPAAGTLAGTTTVPAVGGLATFVDLSIDKVGAGYTLTAAAPGLTGATSSAINVTIGAASRLTFTAGAGP